MTILAQKETPRRLPWGFVFGRLSGRRYGGEFAVFGRPKGIRLFLQDVLCQERGGRAAEFLHNFLCAGLPLGLDERLNAVGQRRRIPFGINLTDGFAEFHQPLVRLGEFVNHRLKTGLLLLTSEAGQFGYVKGRQYTVDFFLRNGLVAVLVSFHLFVLSFSLNRHWFNITSGNNHRGANVAKTLPANVSAAFQCV